MCISTAALALFLNTVGLDLLTFEPGIIRVHATSGDVVWALKGDLWCTDAPRKGNEQ